MYHHVQTMLSESKIVTHWPAMQEIIERGVARRPRDWQLPLLASEAVGGSREQALPAMAALACVQISIILVDDLLDDDPRGEYLLRGAPAVANLALGFQALGLDVLHRHPPLGGLAAEVAVGLDGLNEMAFSTAFGQYQDGLNPADEASYWQVVTAKSTPFYRTAFYMGAVYGGACPDLAAQLRQIGVHYGEMIQIHDDLQDSLQVPASPDWLQGRATLPILYARLVSHPEQGRFIEMTENITAPGALADAQAILVRSGAISYGIDQILRRYRTARAMLASLSLARPDKVEHLLAGLVRPITSLFQTIGARFNERGLTG